MLSVGIASWGTVRGLRTMARRMFSIVEPYGQCRMVADDRAAVSTGERVSFSIEWTVFRENVETPGLFVLLGGERAAGVTVLPKRGPRTPRTWTGSGRSWTGPSSGSRPPGRVTRIRFRTSIASGTTRRLRPARHLLDQPGQT
ncbi:hypothetical protein ACFU8W_31930 [Streptomyces sp. NPDC057565]|uniref:hypothetical protein n=1 Tax=Streptomyces sp. NPDC057565 TaxID=3346169 RepID=UPI0036B520ED